jgi:hypothetical protein
MSTPVFPFPPISIPGLPGLFPAGPPLLLAAVPASGPTTGGNIVLLVGLNLGAATGVSFGGTPATVVSSSDPLGLTAVVLAPAHAAGTVLVTVTTATGTSNAVNYTYAGGVPAVPTATAVTPATGPVTGGTPFTLTGTDLAGAIVLFNGVPATAVSVSAAGTSLTGITPAGVAGGAAVTVVTPAGSATVPGGFTYTAAVPGLPVVGSLLPATGPVIGGTAIVVTGSNLTGASVTIGGVPVTGLSVNAAGTLLAGVTPAGVAGNAPVVVTNAAGSVTVPGGFLYI